MVFLSKPGCSPRLALYLRDFPALRAADTKNLNKWWHYNGLEALQVGGICAGDVGCQVPVCICICICIRTCICVFLIDAFCILFFLLLYLLLLLHFSNFVKLVYWNSSSSIRWYFWVSRAVCLHVYLIILWNLFICLFCEICVWE